MTVYDVHPDKIGTFDLVFFFGTLYHLRHPLLALEKLAGVCAGKIIVESAICDDYSPYNGGMGKGYAGEQMVMEFYPDTQYGNNATNWWAPNLLCLANMVRVAGFKNIEAWKLANPEKPKSCRGFVTGVKA